MAAPFIIIFCECKLTFEDLPKFGPINQSTCFIVEQKKEKTKKKELCNAPHN
jgi:hypothetical protein